MKKRFFLLLSVVIFIVQCKSPFEEEQLYMEEIEFPAGTFSITVTKSWTRKSLIVFFESKSDVPYPQSYMNFYKSRMGSQWGSGVGRMKCETVGHNRWIFPEDKETYELLIDAEPEGISFGAEMVKNIIVIDLRSDHEKWKKLYGSIKQGYEIAYK